jgi:hypothetical protein
VPEPGSVLLLGSTVLTIVGMSMLRKRARPRV